MTLMNVAHVSGLSHHLLSLRRIVDVGTIYIGAREAIRTVFAKSGDELFAPSYGQSIGIFGYCTDRSSEEKAHAAIAPGTRPTPSTAADINDFHCSHGHMHEDGPAAQDGESDLSEAPGTAGTLSRVLGGGRGQEVC